MNQPTEVKPAPPRVFVTYAHDSPEHVEDVRRFATFLRERMAIDAHLDVWYEDVRRDWAAWALGQLEKSTHVLAIASPKFRERADGMAPPNVGWGSTFEGALLRDRMTRDLATWITRILPVVLPGHGIEEIPEFLFPYTATHYVVSSVTVEGLAELHRALTGRPRFTLPKLGEPLPEASSIEAAPPVRRGQWVLLTSLPPINRGGDVRFGEADIDGRHHGDSIVYRPQLFASATRGVVEFTLGRRYRTFEATAGVLDDATDAGQIGHFQVFLDGEQYTSVPARYGQPIVVRVNVTSVLRLRLVAYRPGTTGSPLLAGARIAGGQSNRLPELAWGNPRLLTS